MGSAAAPSPYQRVETTSELPQWKKELYGFTKDAPEYSPFKALSRQAGTLAKMAEGMTTRPSWSSMYEAYGVAPGTDLTPYIQATRTGQLAPQAPIPASPAAGDIPAFTAPSQEVDKKKAAQGGLMSLRKGYAPGGKVTPKYNAKSSADDKLSALQTAVNSGYNPKPAELSFMQNMADTAGVRASLGDTAYTIDPKTGSIKPNARGASQSSADYASYLNKFGAAGVSLDPKLVKQYGVQTPSTRDASAPSAALYSTAMESKTPFYDVNQQYGQYGGVTNPIYQQALDQLRAVSKTPEQFGQATGIMSDAANRLMAQSGYTPQQVASRDITGRDVTAASVNRGDIRDIAAQLAQVERYNAANIERTKREEAATTAGPKSWTDPGVAQQYMNPYQQAVTDQELFEANRQAQMRENQQRSQAAQQKAFGGTRAALQESEGRRNLGYLLADIQAKGGQQAYQSGMGQFQAEQGLGSQVGMSNTQQINQLKSQYMQMGLTEAQANQAAINAASQFNAAAQNTAYNNYVAQQLQAQQANQMMDWNAASQNANMLQQANLANQQYGQGGFQTQQANQNAALQAAIQNQQAGLSAQGLNLQALNQAGQMGQGIGALGTSMWNLQQNIPQLWGAAGQTVQNLAQQRANSAQQTAQNYLGGMANAYNPVTNLLAGTPGTTGTQNISRIPGAP